MSYTQGPIYVTPQDIYKKLVTQKPVTIMNMGSMFLFIMTKVSEQQRRIYTRTDIYVTPQDIQKTCYTKTFNNNEHGE